MGTHYIHPDAGLWGFITNRLAVRIHYRQTGAGLLGSHYIDVIMTMVASQITSLTIVYSIVYFRRRSKKTSKLGVTGLCAGNSPGTGEFPTQMASYTVKFPFDDVIMITDVLVLGCWDPLQTDWCWAAGIHYRQTGAGLLGSITDRLVLGCWDPLQTDWCWAAGIHYRQTGAGLLGSITDRLVLGCWDPLQTDWCWAIEIY